MADLQDVRTSIKGALQGASGGGWALTSGRVVMGYLPVTRATGSGFWSSCTTGASGSFAIVRFGGVPDDDDFTRRNAFPTFSCSVDVYCAIDKDVANNGSGVVQFLEALRKAVHAAISGGCTYDPPEIITLGSVALLHYQLDCISKGCGS